MRAGDIIKKDYSLTEETVLNYLSYGTRFFYNGKEYFVQDSGKPTCKDGEPKTDAYILGKQIDTNESVEFKISCKQNNADFLENKISAERAEEILGSNWQRLVETSTRSIEQLFLSRPLVFKKRSGHTQKGSITLGWRFEFLNKMGGLLSGKMPLSLDQIVDIYAGDNIDEGKKDSYVNGKKIRNSGVANFVLQGNLFVIFSPQQIIDNLVPVNVFARAHSNIFFACKALNYRSFSKKTDGDRPLSVSVHWTCVNKKLTPSIHFDNPLTTRGNEVYEKLLSALKELGVQDTDGLNSTNLDPRVIVVDE